MHYEDIIDFWFKEIEQKDWWRKDPDFDQLINERFLGVHNAAIKCELFEWRKYPQGRLAEIIILDQFSRNIYRHEERAFAYDALALLLAQEAINVCANQAMNPGQKTFLYMPFMHSESVVIHEIAIKLFSEQGLDANLEFEFKHKAVIDRYGRYPHRNKILGRQSTEAELKLLKEPGSAF